MLNFDVFTKIILIILVVDPRF